MLSQVFPWAKDTGDEDSLLFQEGIMRYLSDPDTRYEIGFDMGQPLNLTMNGLALDAFLCIGPRHPNQWKLLELVNRWTKAVQSDISPLKALLYIIFSEQAAPDNLIATLDSMPRIKSSLGCGLVRRRKFDLATPLLEGALLHSRGAFRLVEFGHLSAELVKCFNALQIDEKGESFGKHALTLLSPSEVDIRTDLMYLTIATGDSLIAQAKYGEAKIMLTSILGAQDLPPDLAAVTALRLSKVNRRLLIEDGSTLALASPLNIALPCIAQAEAQVKLEFVTEIGATIAQLVLNTTGNALDDHEVQKFLRAALEVFSQDENLRDDWRLQTVIDYISEERSGITPEHGQASTSASDHPSLAEDTTKGFGENVQNPTVHESWSQKSVLTFGAHP
jgi:hypothetical protein